MKVPIICACCKKTFLLWPSRIIKSDGNRRKFCSIKCATTALQPFWKSHTERRRRSIRAKGDSNANWRGGLCSINKLIRSSAAYKDLRREVFRRDKYTCKECRQVGGNLVVHHIEAVAHKPERIMDASNMITLCEKCHCITDNYLSKAFKHTSVEIKGGHK